MDFIYFSIKNYLYFTFLFPNSLNFIFIVGRITDAFHMCASTCLYDPGKGKVEEFTLN